MNKLSLYVFEFSLLFLAGAVAAWPGYIAATILVVLYGISIIAPLFMSIALKRPGFIAELSDPKGTVEVIKKMFEEVTSNGKTKVHIVVTDFLAIALLCYFLPTNPVPSGIVLLLAVGAIATRSSYIKDCKTYGAECEKLVDNLPPT